MFCTKCGGTSYVGKRQADSMTTLQERLRAFSVMGGTHERRLMIEAADALDAAENDKQAAVMAERERCANEAEYRDGACDICGCSTPMRIAAAIRRGE